MSKTQVRGDYATFNATATEAVEGLRLLGQAAAKAGIEKDLLELVKLRASQINGCAFCLQLHLTIARKLGVAQVKLDLLAVWRDAGVYSAREQAALAWTEALTLITGHEVDDALFARTQDAFPGDELQHLTTAVAAINAWNRIAGALQFAPPL